MSANPPNPRNYLLFAFTFIALFWLVYLIENFVDLERINLRVISGELPLSIFVPILATPVIAISTLWRYRSASIFAAGADTVFATIVKIPLLGVGVHTRVTLQYEYQGRTYKVRHPIYDSVVANLEVGQQIQVQVLRKKPKKIMIPENMEAGLVSARSPLPIGGGGAACKSTRKDGFRS